MKTSRGFTLIEIIIVVAIIALLAGIIIPSLFRARKSVNDKMALTELHSAKKYLENYAIDNNGLYASADGKADLSELVVGGYIHRDNICGRSKAGHTFNCTINRNSYFINATANVAHVTGDKDYQLTISGVQDAEADGNEGI